MAKDKKICIVLLFTWLLYSGNSLNWQGTGNLSQSNISAIWTYINSNFNTSKTSSDIKNSENQYLSNFASGLSTELNNQWAQAWNVFVIYLTDSNSDSVLYGYGFRDHWMWYNGKQMIDNYFSTFIIWKDYNCHAWVTYNSITSLNTNLEAGLASELSSLVASRKGIMDINYIWSTAQDYSQHLDSNAKFPNSAFSIIASQSKNVNYYGRFCAVGYYTQKGLQGNGAGAVFFMQMR